MFAYVGRTSVGKGVCLCVSGNASAGTPGTRLLNPISRIQSSVIPASLKEHYTFRKERKYLLSGRCQPVPLLSGRSEVRGCKGKPRERKKKESKGKEVEVEGRERPRTEKREDEATKEDGGGEEEVINTNGRMRRKREGKERRGERGYRGAILWVLRLIDKDRYKERKRDREIGYK